MTCTKCGRASKRGEREGDGCGWRYSNLTRFNQRRVRSWICHGLLLRTRKRAVHP